MWDRPASPSLTGEGRGRARSRSASRGRAPQPPGRQPRQASVTGSRRRIASEALPLQDGDTSGDEPLEDAGRDRANSARVPVAPDRDGRAAALDRRSRAHRQAWGAEEPDLWASDDTSGEQWSTSRVQQLSNAGGLASRSSRSRHLHDRDPPAQEDVLKITSDVVRAVFGRDRASILRVNGLPMQEQQAKSWKFRTSQQNQLRAAGLHVPADFCPVWFFYTFQFDRNSLLATAPLKIHDLEQWLWMHARWVIADVNDMTKQSDFLHVLAQVDSLSGKLNKLANDLQSNPGLTVSQALRDDFAQVLRRFTVIRADFVVKIVADGLSEPGLCAFHAGMSTLGRIYAHDSASLSDFMRSVQEQINTQSSVFDDSAQREGFVSKSFLCMARAFVCGVKGGPVPAGPNPLDTPPSALTGVAVAPLAPTAPPTPMAAAAPPYSVPPTAGASVGSSALTLQSVTAGGQSTMPPPLYQTTQQAPVFASPSDPDTLARQIAAGYREAGALIGAPAGGATDGLDLTPPARRVLHAMQVQSGMRAAGSLTTPAPVGQPLPAVHTYPPPYPGAGGLPFPGYVSPAWQPSTPAHSLPPSPYTTQRRDVPGVGGAASSGNLYATGQRPRAALSDELYIPYSTGLLGAYSPYRGISLPPELTCFECNAAVHHFGNECPTRFARVRGEAPPGWKIDGPGAVSKNPAAWTGPELTDAARAEYRGFITRLALVPHATHPVTADEIVAPAPPAPRRPAPRLDGSGRRR